MKVDGRDVLVPMATEESSVVAAVCNSARQCYESGGFTTSVSGTEMIAQIQLVGVSDPQAARIRILERKAEIGAACDACDPLLVRLGGGFRDLEVRVIEAQGGPMVITHIIVDTRDAMGANTVNTMAERLAPEHRGMDRRQGLPAHPVQPGGPPAGPRPRHLDGGGDRRRGGARRHDLRLPLRRG